ncbi:HAMP domain-containing histidine kinase [Verticiella sediminum]|uniref:histidine kinase n=1 Tax=Verticiella sediminum TaxID=1247510 RepID=A0A556AJ04_9BURK|nr:HAMP domain-containing sensor histidine kinase [Verticiella sediminum]TSH92867.1 HAMP domain-containing histidine kinase [Verticiella sediminum]
MHDEVVELRVEHEGDIVRARQLARLLGAAAGLADGGERLAGMAAEAARYVFADCQPAYLRFWLGALAPQRRALGLEVSCRRRDGQLLNQDNRALAPGLFEAFGTVDQHSIDQCGDDTRIRLHQWLVPGHAFDAGSLERLRADFGMTVRGVTMAAVRLQNHELLTQMLALQQWQHRLAPGGGVAAELHAQIGVHAADLARLAAANSRFLASVGHELRGPLSSIYAISRLLLARTDGELTDEQETQVRLIHEASGELLASVDDLADLARIESGTMVLRLGEFDVGELYTRLRDTFGALGAKPGVVLSFEVPPGLVVFSDRHKVAQILRNLIVNALKFTLEGAVRVSCTVDAEHVRLLVADTGIGIAPEDVQLIFRENVQLAGDAGVRPLGAGLGLGLALSQRLATAIGGRIEVQSEPRTGSVFALRIPRRYLAGNDSPKDAWSAESG